jgi:hypothetical protein
MPKAMFAACFLLAAAASAGCRPRMIWTSDLTPNTAAAGVRACASNGGCPSGSIHVERDADAGAG